MIFNTNPAKTHNQPGHTAEDYVRRREEAGSGTAKRSKLACLLKTLASSPADRAWCRYGLVVLCKSRLGQEGVGTILDRLVTMAVEELFESSWGLKNVEQMVSCVRTQLEKYNLAPTRWARRRALGA